ncbi:hypothetical protein SAMN05421758_103282 [Salimicrobium salexigens]|uniref:Uncharacterized protein n=1 Tax=Salimicrobium salexigens TaxID=908941 RepID=A0ABY1KTE9_9BACI|nr:hypothetical protein SAMN05421758_103282 [Salimicrobium salexigens]
MAEVDLSDVFLQVESFELQMGKEAFDTGIIKTIAFT